MAEDRLAAALGGEAILGQPADSFAQLTKLVRRGLPYDSFEFVARNFRLGIERTGHLIALSKTTRNRRREEGRLSPDESDRLCRIARILAHGMDVFEDDLRLYEWLSTPNTALGKLEPIELLDTDLGAAELDRLLGRIEHGTFS